MSRGHRTCPVCGTSWTLRLNPGAAHQPWHDDPRCADCRTAAPAEPEATPAAAPDLYESLTRLLTAVSSSELEEFASNGPVFVEPGHRTGIGWTDQERRQHITAWLELSAPSVPQGDWVEQALCAQTDPEAFLPDKGGSTAAAKAICGRCPVTNECLDWAVETDQQAGVYGGLSAKARRALRRERAAS